MAKPRPGPERELGFLREMGATSPPRTPGRTAKRTRAAHSDGILAANQWTA
jgi:hypothetical protein